MTTHLTDTQKTQIRIALATWEGWTEINQNANGGFYGTHPKGPRGTYDDLPNYPADLNCSHAIEVNLTDEERERYLPILWHVCEKPRVSDSRELISASAEHRALALFRALNLGELGD